METHFDLIILGGGAGAFAAAIKANEYQARTLMLNAGLPLGGTCVNVGCVPSKHLLAVGYLKHQAEHPRFRALASTRVEFDFAAAIDEELETVAALRAKKYTSVMEHLEHVTYLEARAHFTSPHEVNVNGQSFSSDRFLIAVGSTAQPPPIPGIQDVGYWTHVDALQNKSFPKRLLILGAGSVALEFAQMYRHFGSEVTLLVRGDRLYKRTEPEISEAVEAAFQEEGIAIRKETRVLKFTQDGGEKRALVETNGQMDELAFDQVLIGTGKTANTNGLGLDAAGVELAANSAIRVNPWYQTSAPHIYAVGDAIDMPKRLETTAGKEGSFATTNLLTGMNRFKINYDLVPSVVFTTPAIADVGLLDEEVEARGIECECRVVNFAQVPKALALNDTRGVIKMVAERRTGRIVGVHLLAPRGEDLINEAMYILRARMTVDDVIDALTVFPTLSESIKLAALSFRTDIERLSCCI